MACSPTDAIDTATLPDETHDLTERDFRMCCVRAAIDLHRPGETTAGTIVAEAAQILEFLNGSAK